MNTSAHRNGQPELLLWLHLLQSKPRRIWKLILKARVNTDSPGIKHKHAEEFRWALKFLGKVELDVLLVQWWKCTFGFGRFSFVCCSVLCKPTPAFLTPVIQMRCIIWSCIRKSCMWAWGLSVGFICWRDIYSYTHTDNLLFLFIDVITFNTFEYKIKLMSISIFWSDGQID